MSDDQLLQIQELLESASSSLKTANAMLRSITGISDTDHERHMSRAGTMGSAAGPVSGKVVEGIFDGQNMVDSQGNTYPVPANYASKSKLVEGDGMKLTITDEGKFIYKQIAPVKRRTVVGVLIQEDGQYKVLAEGKAFRVLLASVTFYRAEVGDQVTILLPEEGEAKWGAVDAVIPKHLSEAAARSTVSRAQSDDGELKPM
ncbi:MAG TPA: hypothetical protein DEB30_03740 [Candidatus Peribacter riflensis]|uniref:50S ribosomal protein L7/L12 n=1 Tax=Candidatus Peribacter riflensis TaxID=1735162 RepID=A0A0S1SVI9_9BACT|nr:MAG: hypothetical protein PeribacterA2_0734 [Candidatus Peribacter riflensis]OGJ77787.1 MAG: hypothetical protein A2398_00760 [Candidatus Peribacteria bacterium RIFOXYB1_FULL_57_12]ALM11201.1 MAG: hypothetical protein PeribacterB2_0735 [Candidatus Peribacter riflensis]ALM12304.1 MAG: hypothetical protein PeribacterC2_0735 [Candidatus Peribacter riflensis]ALM13406.1 MAG: hypothetical protein PeribacterD1_0735 [Candidatus Peribacter riflensis]